MIYTSECLDLICRAYVSAENTQNVHTSGDSQIKSSHADVNSTVFGMSLTEESGVAYSGVVLVQRSLCQSRRRSVTEI